MSSSKTILTSIAKLNGQNWHTWSKQTESYLTMEDFWELVDPLEAIPTAAAALKRDKKAYAHIWFLVEPDFRDTIVKIKSGREAWAALKAEYEKDTPSTQMNPCQHFYSLSHDPTIGIIPFTNQVLAVVCQLESIKEITAALKEFEENETLCHAYSTPNNSIKQELLLYANKAGRHGSGGGGFKTKFEDFNWGNSRRREGVCWCCGRSGHIAQNCVADMPADMKEHILNHHAHFTTSEPDDIAQAHLATDNINSILAPTILSQDQLAHFAPDDPLILVLSTNHQAHTVIDGACRIFEPDEDVPVEF